MLRKHQILVIGVIFFGSIFFMISQLDTTPGGYTHNDTHDLKYLQEKLKFVEKQLENNKLAMTEVIVTLCVSNLMFDINITLKHQNILLACFSALKFKI